MFASSNAEDFFIPSLTIPILFLAGVIYTIIHIFQTSRSSLSKVPGPLSYRLSPLRMIYADWTGQRVRTIKTLHSIYGSAVRIASNELSFSTLTAQRTIYGAGSPFERTAFYRPFDVYGCQNLFTFGPVAAHRDRKKLLSHIYANRTVLSTEIAPMIEEKVAQFVKLIEENNGKPVEIFSSLHYFSLDAISTFVYGPHHGGTTALLGTPAHRALLDDILSPTRRKLAWFAVHLPNFTRWAYSQKWPISSVLNAVGLIPMNPPTTYSGIRVHALAASNSFIAESPFETKTGGVPAAQTVIARLRNHQLAHPGSLSDLEIASECADHLLAGIDTTADTLLFLIWVLSLPKHAHFQKALRSELHTHHIQGTVEFDPATGVPNAKSVASLPYLNAVIREALRLYTPLPATEPRVCYNDTVVDGFRIPAGTVVGMAPYVLHRDEAAYPSPLVFDPERWLPSNDNEEGKEKEGIDVANRNFWAFSSGARMCIGMHLAMAEMLTLVAAIYNRYETNVRTGEEGVSPGVTSRFEVFWDESMEKDKMVEHECWIQFKQIEKT